MAFFGTGAGPLISGVIAENLSWRWIHWTQLIVNGVMLLSVAVLFKETRGSVLLIRKAQDINAHLDAMAAARPDSEKLDAVKIRWRCRAEEERASLSTMVRVSLTRPFLLLFTEPVVFFFSLWAAFSWGVLYLFVFPAFSKGLQDRYLTKIKVSTGCTLGIFDVAQLHRHSDGSCVHFNVCRIPYCTRPQYHHRKLHPTTLPKCNWSRETSVRFLCAGFVTTNRHVLVWLDFFSDSSLDSSDNCSRGSDDWHIFHLPCRFQLLCRHIPPVRLFCSCCTKLQQEYAWWILSTGDGCNVPSDDVPGCKQLPGWCGVDFECGPLGLGHLRGQNQTKEQVCERNYGVACGYGFTFWL